MKLTTKSRPSQLMSGFFCLQVLAACFQRLPTRTEYELVEVVLLPPKVTPPRRPPIVTLPYVVLVLPLG